MNSLLKQFTFCIAFVVSVFVALPAEANASEEALTWALQRNPVAATKLKTLEPTRSNFLLGKGFVVARMSASSMNSDRAAFHVAAVDLMYLIESLGESAETLELREVLRSMLNGKIDAAGASAKIDVVLGSYALRQPKDGRWYLESGAATASMVYSAFYADAERLEIDLAKIALLSKDSPKNVDSALLNALRSLCAKNKSGRISFEEFESLTELGLAIFKKIEG